MNSEQTLSRKERERLARRDEIITAASHVFSERGFAGATLDEIAESAEYGKGTIYNYFTSKEELFVSVILMGMGRFQQFVREATEKESTPEDRIATFIDASFDFFAQHRQLFSILEIERNNLARSLNDEMFNRFCQQEEQLHRFLIQLFDDGVKGKNFKKMNSKKLAESLFGLIHVTMIRSIREPETHDLKKDAGFIKKLFFEGIRK